MIIDATYTSVWDGGIEVTSKCKVNTEKKEVFDIEIVDVNGLEVLEKEYLAIDGKEYSVSWDRDENTEYHYM